MGLWKDRTGPVARAASKSSVPDGVHRGMTRLPLIECAECGREKLILQQLSLTSLNPCKISVKCPRNDILQQVKDWRFFMWLDRYLDMVAEISMRNAAALSMSREMQRRNDAMRAELDAITAELDAMTAEFDATRAEFDAMRDEFAALIERLGEKVAALNAELLFLAYFLFIILLVLIVILVN